MKTLDFAYDPTQKRIVYEAFQGPDINDYQKKRFRSITLDIDEYGPGDILGVDSFLVNAKLGFTAIT